MTNWRETRLQRELAEEIAELVAEKIFEKVTASVFAMVSVRIEELAQSRIEVIPKAAEIKGTRYLSAKDVAHLFGCSPKTICDWCHSGKLPSINTGSALKPKFRIDPADIVILKNRPAPTPVKRQRCTAPSVI